MLTILEDIKLKSMKIKSSYRRMIHTKVTVVICKLEMLNSRGILDRPPLEVLRVETTALSKPLRSHHHEICRPNL